MIQSKHGVVKGLSITIIVISIISICISLALGGVCVLSGMFLGNSSNQEELYKSFTDSIEKNQIEFYDEDDINIIPFIGEDGEENYEKIYELDEYSFMWLARFGIFIIMGLLAFIIIRSIFTLIVGIYGVKASNDYTKLKTLSGLSIAGIVTCLIFFSFVMLILMILLLIYTSKQKDFFQALNKSENIVINNANNNNSGENFTNSDRFYESSDTRKEIKDNE